MFSIIGVFVLVAFGLMGGIIMRGLFESPEKRLDRMIKKYLKILRSNKSKSVDRHFAAQEINELCLSGRLNIDQMKDCLSALEDAILSHPHSAEKAVLDKAGFLLKGELLKKTIEQ